MNPNQLKRIFPNASASIIAANAQDYDHSLDSAGLPNTEPQQQPAALAPEHEGQTQGTGCPHVRFTLSRVNLLDVDAKYGSCKSLIDGLRKAGLVSGDREGEITLEVRQVKVAHYKDEKTEIEVTTP